MLCEQNMQVHKMHVPSSGCPDLDSASRFMEEQLQD